MKRILREYSPLVALLGLYFFGISKLMHKKSYDPLGVYKFPLFLGIIASVLTIALIVQACRHRKEKPEESVNWSTFFRMLGVVALSAAYLLLLRQIGYVLLTPIYIAGMLLVLGKRDWKRILLLSVIATIVLYVPFRYLFKVLFPKGVLTFLG